MDNNTYNTRIKKDYVSSILQDLQQPGAVEIIECPIGDRQRSEVRRRIVDIRSDPSLIITENEFFTALENDDDV